MIIFSAYCKLTLEDRTMKISLLCALTIFSVLGISHQAKAYNLEACEKNQVANKPQTINLLQPIDQKIVDCIRLDSIASKLLVNSDRYADDSVYSRDLIDLAMMKPTKKELHLAIEKAKKAYGDSIQRDLVRSIDYLFQRERRLDKCTDYLKIVLPVSVIYQNIQKLKDYVRKS
jgi:hypothetical protein